MVTALSEETFGKFFAAQLNQIDGQVFQPAQSICPYEGLPCLSANPALVSLEKLRARLSQSSVHVSDDQPSAAEVRSTINIKFLKKPQGYEGSLTLSTELDLTSFTSTVAALKEWLYKETRLPVKSQKLVYKGKAMSDTAMLKEYIGDDVAAPVVHCMASGPIEADIVVVAAPPVTKPTLSGEFWTGLERYVLDNSGWSIEDSRALLKRFKDGSI